MYIVLINNNIITELSNLTYSELSNTNYYNYKADDIENRKNNTTTIIIKNARFKYHC